MQHLLDGHLNAGVEVVTSAGGSVGKLEKMNSEGLVLRVPPVEKLPEQIRYFPWTSILYIAVVAPNPKM
jgi:hypothetical protein